MNANLDFHLFHKDHNTNVVIINSSKMKKLPIVIKNRDYPKKYFIRIWPNGKFSTVVYSWKKAAKNMPICLWSASANLSLKFWHFHPLLYILTFYGRLINKCFNLQLFGDFIKWVLPLFMDLLNFLWDDKILLCSEIWG